MVYDTVVITYDTTGPNGPENVDIKTTLDLVVDAKCLHMVRNVVIDVWYWTSPFRGLNPVIEAICRAAGKWAGMRKLDLTLHLWGPEEPELNHPAADREDKIVSVSSALAALMPGLREIKFGGFPQTPIDGVLFGQLAGFYADQLQVFHSSNLLVVPQDLMFARLRDVKITGCFSGSLEGKLPRLDPEVIESLVLQGLAANDMWSMFCADSDGCAITFPRLTNLDLEYQPRLVMNLVQLPDELPWALQFPAAKRVQISHDGEECPSMENAVFPSRLESLDISRCLSMLPVFAGRNVHVSRSLTLSVVFEPDANNRNIGIANRMLEAADSCRSRKLVIGGMDAIPLELITCTELTHLQLNGSTTADDVMGHIHRQRHLVSLCVDCLTLADVQSDFSIPECTEHEPMAPLDTQIRMLALVGIGQDELPELGTWVLKYLLLRIPTLKSVTAGIVPVEQIQAFIDEYVRWYPHLANFKLMW
ncbi:hypothetical protein H4R19_003099 [Coemansia spiralis]|nr:hypothetical protein H4R19_003099 [Coemansia spiralis]